MPNWCSCDLFISGKIDEIKEFMNAVKYDDESEFIIDHNKIIPYPKEYRDLDELVRIREFIYQELETKRLSYSDIKSKYGNILDDGYNNGGYDWRCKTYGTKWGICDSSLEYVKKRSAKYIFSSAWEPPIPLITKMSDLFHRLEFKLRYYESMMGFSGRFVIKNNIILENYENNKYKGNRGG